MPKKKQKPGPAQNCKGPVFPVGATVRINRPNLWAGHYGEVEKVDGAAHLILVGQNGISGGVSFHVLVCGEHLEEVK